jgi:SSS family solute:Na+ symporter
LLITPQETALNTAPIIFATLTSALIGGGFTNGLAEKVFSTGIIYVVAIWGFSIKEVLIATVIAPRMTAFKDAVSVGDIMGKLYGKDAKVFTGGASALVCAGIAGAQFGAFAYMLEVLVGIPSTYGILIGASIVVLYSSLGGMKAVVANDVIHFYVMLIALPLILIFGLLYTGGVDVIIQTLPSTNLALFDKISVAAAIGLFFTFFFGETLVPPYVQRLLIGKNLVETARGTLWSGLLSFAIFTLVGCIGLIALYLKPDLNPNLALPYVIQTVMPIGFKGLAIAGMMAIVMSAADSFLNAAGIAITQDIMKPLLKKPLEAKRELLFARLSTFIVGSTAVIFSISIASVLDILLYAYNFWTPFILVPLVAGILGYRASSKVFWCSALSGISSVIIWNFWFKASYDIDGALIGIITNFIVFSSLHYLEKRQLVLEPQA